MQVMKAILIGIIVLIGVSVTNCCFNRASNEAKTDSRPKGTPEKFIVSRGKNQVYLQVITSLSI